MSAPQPPRVRSRKPTGRVPWPMVLVEGGEKSGKSYSAALLSSSPRVGATYWIDLGEGSADEYGAIPGVRYEVVEHNGDYHQILARVREVKAHARWAADNAQPPTVLVIDTVSDLWEGLKDFATDRARKRKKLAPDAEVTVSMDLWNEANTRHRRVMTELLTFPGIVVLLARGKDVAALDDNGKPIERQKDYKVEGQKNIAYDATVWVRMSRTRKPEIIGARSVHAGIRPGKDESQPVKAPEADANLLDWLVFDALRCDPRTAHVRDIKQTTGGALLPEEGGEDPRAIPFRVRALEKHATRGELLALLGEAQAAGLAGAAVMDETGEMVPLGALIVRKGKETAPAAPPRLVPAKGAATPPPVVAVPRSAGDVAQQALEEHFVAPVQQQTAPPRWPAEPPADADIKRWRGWMLDNAIVVGWKRSDGTADVARVEREYKAASGGGTVPAATVNDLTKFVIHMQAEFEEAAQSNGHTPTGVAA